MIRSPKFRLPLSGMSYLTFIVLINAIFSSMIVPIIPIYIKNFVSSNVITGYVTAFLSFLMIIYLIFMRKLISRIKKVFLLRIGLLGTGVTVIVLVFLNNIWQFLILEIVRTFFLVAAYISMGLLVREYTTRKSIGRTEGVYFTIANIGWLIGPLIGGLLAAAYSFNLVFYISAVPIIFISFILFLVP